MISRSDLTASHAQAGTDLSPAAVWAAIAPHKFTIAGVSLVLGIAAYGITLLLPPTFTARATIISPQQQQNSAAAALASLGALAGLTGGGAVKSQADQYISVMQSVTVSNRIIDRFKLMDRYDVRYRVDAIKVLSTNVRIVAGKKDNLISIDVDDEEPALAAQMANAYVEELRSVANHLALTEAQQRRVFFDEQLQHTKKALMTAQLEVQRTGFTAGALKSEPKSAAEAYARTKAEIAATEIRLGGLRKSLTDNAPEIQRLVAALGALRSQLAQFEGPSESSSNQDYVSAYREYKYQEALFEIYAKQLELAKMDEARDGTLIQVLDPATPPEKRSKPKRTIIALLTVLLSGIAGTVFFAVRGLRRQGKAR